MSKITIAIPTFNRNEKLIVNLKKLLPQITTQKIIIVDNHSDIPVIDSLSEIIKNHENIDLKVYRNKTNIGIAANFLRCFEYCETEWMWLLSDDDEVCTNAIEIIEKDTNRFYDYNFFNYSSSMVEEGISYSETFPPNFPYNTKEDLKNHKNYRKESFTTIGLKDLINKFDSLVNFIFVSSGVYNISKVLPHLRIGYIYAYSLLPHISTVLASIGESGKVLLSKDKVVEFYPPDANDTWSRLTFSQVVTLVMEVPLALDDKSFNILFRKLTYWFMTDEQLFHEVNITYKHSNKMKQWMFIQIIARTIFKPRSLKQKLKICIFFIKLFFPQFNTFYQKNVEFNSKEPLARI